MDNNKYINIPIVDWIESEDWLLQKHEAAFIHTGNVSEVYEYSIC
jgi:hypothetical protein